MSVVNQPLVNYKGGFSRSAGAEKDIAAGKIGSVSGDTSRVSDGWAIRPRRSSAIPPPAMYFLNLYQGRG